MKINSEDRLLSISIPTYNRSDKLELNLRLLVKCLIRHNIPIFIFDNSDNNLSFQVFLKIKSNYNYIHYYKNQKNIGAERNFILALKSPNTKYVWLFGDDDKFDYNGFENLYSFLSSSDYDLILLNQNSYKKNYFSDQKINDVKTLFTKYMAHMTYISVLIYSNNLIKSMYFEKYLDLTFSYIFPIFELSSVKSYFYSSILVEPLPNRINSFSHLVTSYFVYDLFSSISLLSDVFNKNQRKYAHRKVYNNYFNKFYYLLKARFTSNEINLSKFIKNRKAFSSAFNFIDNLIILFLCLLPKFK